MTGRLAVALACGAVTVTDAGTPSAALAGPAPIPVLRAGQVLARVPVRFGGGTAAVAAARDLYLPASERPGSVLHVDVPHDVRGPLAQAQPLGSVSVLVSGRVAASERLQTVSPVAAPDLGGRLQWLLGRRGVAAALALLAGCSLTLVTRRRRLAPIARTAG